MEGAPARRLLQLGALAAALALGGFFLARARSSSGAQAAAVSHEPADAHAARLSREHGVVVGFGDPSTFYTPPYVAEDARLPYTEMERAAPASVPVALDAIEESLKLYPPGYVAKVAHGIFVCGVLTMRGAEAGGTVGPEWIILAAPSSIGRESIRLTSLIGVHHELSSLVLKAKPGALDAWTDFAPSGHHFVTTAADALAVANASDPAPETGFLSAYGATTAENDFNVYAEKMFTEPGKVAKLVAGYPLIEKKAAFVVETYAAVDGTIRGTFRKLGLAAVVREPPAAITGK